MEAPFGAFEGAIRGVWRRYFSIIISIFITMKAMTKQQLAESAGVSVRTLNRWCKPYRQELEEMGLLPMARVLPPHIVKYLSEKFCIDVR